MNAISNRQPQVIVEYLSRGHRVQRLFLDPYVARRFYVAKYKMGALPKVLSVLPPTIRSDVMSATTTTPASKKTTKPASKKSAKKVVKPASKKQSTGNLKREDAKEAILKILAKGRANRNELKAAVPYGNYTSLMAEMEEAGQVSAVQYEDDAMTCYELRAAGRKRVAKK